MAEITFDAVSLAFPIYDAGNLSLRNSLVSLATGGVLGKSRNVTVVRALNDVSFQVRDGDAIGIVGHNGAGKSTLLRTIAGIYPPTSGRVQVEGSLTSVFELGAGLDHEVDGRQNIINLCLLHGYTYAEALHYLDRIIAFSELGEFIELPIRTYSSGMLLRLMFSMATIRMPDIFLLDEMFSTGDQQFQRKSTQRIAEIIENSKIFFFASHDYALLKRYCNRFFKIEHGRLSEIASLD
jgi:ABC-type polysaccharide/polyol phosphate transport system ATPase subunit